MAFMMYQPRPNLEPHEPMGQEPDCSCDECEVCRARREWADWVSRDKSAAAEFDYWEEWADVVFGAGDRGTVRCRGRDDLSRPQGEVVTIEQMKAELHAAHTKMLQAKGHRRSPAVMQFRRLAEIYTPSLLASHDSLEKVVEAMKGKERGSE